MRAGLPARQTHDYRRNGTTTLFAALNTLNGTVIERCPPRHRHSEFVQFLNHVDQKVSSKLDVHIIMDNYATHKRPVVKAWFAAHPRYHIHFTPTSSSWLNAVERFSQKSPRSVFGTARFGAFVNLNAQSRLTSRSTTSMPSPHLDEVCANNHDENPQMPLYL